jgi:hypothetical protein
MPTRRPARSRQQLEARARELAAEQGATGKLEVRTVEDVVRSTGDQVSPITLRQAGQPNARPVVVVLDQQGDPVDVVDVQRREGARLFAPSPAAVDLSGVADTLVTVDPPTFDVLLGCCGEGAETVRVHIPATGVVAKADVYFLADTTGSMFEEIDAVRTSGSMILTALAGLGLDLAFGVGSYRDFPGAPIDAFTPQLAPTTVIADANAAISSWSVNGGGDPPEAQLFALDALAEPPGGPSAGGRAPSGSLSGSATLRATTRCAPPSPGAPPTSPRRR